MQSMLKNKRTNKHLMKSRMPELKGASAAVIYTMRSSRRYVSDVPRCPRGRREQPKTPSRLPGQHCSSGIYSALLRRVLGVRAETAWTPPSAGGRLDRYETGTPGALVEGQEALSRGSAEAPPRQATLSRGPRTGVIGSEEKPSGQRMPLCEHGSLTDPTRPHSLRHARHTRVTRRLRSSSSRCAGCFGA